MQDIWAATDKPLIDRMSRKTPQSATPAENRFASNNDSSDTDSDSSSRGSFSAVPQEFRPTLIPSRSPVTRRKRGGTKLPSNHASNDSLLKHPLAVSERLDSNKRPIKSPEMRNRNEPTTSISNKCSLMENSPANIAKSTENEIPNDQAAASSDSLSMKERQSLVLMSPKKGTLPESQFSSSRIAANLNSVTLEQVEHFLTKNSLPVAGKSSAEENSNGRKAGGAAEKIQKPRGGISMEVVLPKNNEEPLERVNRTGAPRRYVHRKTMEPQRNSVLPHHSRRVSTSKQAKIKMKPQFGYINVSEEIQISRTQFVEFDFAKMTIDDNMNKISNNAFKPHRVPDKMNNIQGIQKKKNVEYMNCMKRNKGFSQNEVTNFNEKTDCIKWDSGLSFKLKQPSRNIFLQNSITDDDKLRKASNNKVEWIVETFREERTVVSVRGLINEDRKDRLQEDDDMEDFSSASEDFSEDFSFSNRIPVPRNKSPRHKFNDSVHDIQNNDVPNIGRVREKSYFYGNNLNESSSLRNSQNVNEKVETIPKYYKKEQRNCDSKPAENMSGNNTRCRNYVKELWKFPLEGNVDSPETKYDELVKLTKENDTLPKSASQKSSNNIKSKKVTDSEEKNQLIQYGKDISDLIIGSHMGLSAFFSIYNEWKISRCKLIEHFQQLYKTIQESSKRYKWYRDLPKIATGVTLIATTIPNPYVGMAAKVVSIISSLLQHFYSNSKTSKVDVDEPEITGSLLRDIDASNELYMYGLQCNQQMVETSKLIEEFHSKAANREFFDGACLDADIMTFIQGMLEYKPSQRTFYKKLHKCFQELLQKGSSPISTRFCEPFTLNPVHAVDVIGYLNWRFVDFNVVSVQYELESIHNMIQGDGSTSMKDLGLRITNCIRILEDDLKSVERCVSEVTLFDGLFKNVKLDSK